MSLPPLPDSPNPDSPEHRAPEHRADATLCAVLTGHGRSAIAVIGLRGRDTTAIINHCFRPNSAQKLETGQIRYGVWSAGDGVAAGESIVLTPIDNDCVQIHCHGGPAAIERIISDLQAFGATRIDGADWDVNDNRIIVEARQVLSRCLTTRTAAIAMDQVRGALADWAIDWIEQLSGEQIAAVSIESLAAEAGEILSRAPLTTRLTEPFRVVVVGPPNVGKSTLVNAIVGYDRSITHDQAGTTRDVLHADTVIDGLPIRLSDTAGLRNSDEAIEREGIARASAAAADADLVLKVTASDVSAPDDSASDAAWQSDSDSIASHAQIPSPKTGSSSSTLLGEGKVGGDNAVATLNVYNKLDLLPRGDQPPTAALATDALTGQGIADLMQAIAETLGRRFPAPGDPVLLTGRQTELVSQLTITTTPDAAIAILSELHGGQPTASPG